MVVLLSGKITGYPYYKEDFQRAQNTLEQMGHIVLSPLFLPDGLTYDDYMVITRSFCYVCEAIYMLDGWELSNGATIEYELAKSLGKQIWYESEEEEQPVGIY